MKIQVVVDLSEISSNVVDEAIKFAKATDAEVWLLHVAEPEPEFVGSKVDTEVMRDVHAEEFHKEHRQLQLYASQFEKSGLKTTALLIQGETVKTILNQAKRHTADIIVMGSHKKGALAHLILGSTSEGVLHHSNIPVMIIPVPEN